MLSIFFCLFLCDDFFLNFFYAADSYFLFSAFTIEKYAAFLKLLYLTTTFFESPFPPSLSLSLSLSLSSGYDTELSRIVGLQFWKIGKRGVPCDCYYTQTLTIPKYRVIIPSRVSSFSQIDAKKLVWFGLV